jgi:carbamoyltransferase
MGTGIEALAVGNCWLVKEEQDPSFQRDYSSGFELD